MAGFLDYFSNKKTPVKNFFAIVVIFFISLQPQNIFSYLVSKRVLVSITL